MKTKILILVAIMAFGLSINSCKDDDNTDYGSIDGAWNLINVSGGFAGTNDNFDSGTILWTFNTQNQSLSVRNNNSQNVIHDGLQTGTYNFSIIDNNGNSFLIVESDEIGRMIFSTNSFLLDENEQSTGAVNDGFQFSFER